MIRGERSSGLTSGTFKLAHLLRVCVMKHPGAIRWGLFDNKFQSFDTTQVPARILPLTTRRRRTRGLGGTLSAIFSFLCTGMRLIALHRLFQMTLQKADGQQSMARCIQRNRFDLSYRANSNLWISS